MDELILPSLQSLIYDFQQVLLLRDLTYRKRLIKSNVAFSKPISGVCFHKVLHVDNPSIFLYILKEA